MRGLTSSKKKYAGFVQEVIQNRAFLKFSPKDTIPSVVERMHAENSGSGAIVDTAGRFVGLLTEREIVRKIFGNLRNMKQHLEALSDPEESKFMTAWDVMILKPETLHPHDSIEDALDVITYFGYRYMPVVNSDIKIEGIVDARELHQHAQAKARDIIETKDTLLSYFMYPERYGGAGGYNIPQAI